MTALAVLVHILVRNRFVILTSYANAQTDPQQAPVFQVCFFVLVGRFIHILYSWMTYTHIHTYILWVSCMVIHQFINKYAKPCRYLLTPRLRSLPLCRPPCKRFICISRNGFKLLLLNPVESIMFYFALLTSTVYRIIIIIRIH